MKQTIITKEIDGYQVVAGLGRAVVDPVKLRELMKQEIPKTAEHRQYLQIQAKHRNLIAGLFKQVQKKRLTLQGQKLSAGIKDSPEYKAWKKVQETANAQTSAGIEALSEAWNKYKIKEKELLKTEGNVNAELFQTKEHQDWLKAQEDAKTAILKAYEKVGEKQKEILKESGDIFFTPKAGEEIIETEQAELIRERLKTLPEKTFLTVEGEEVIDRRGEKYWIQDKNKTWSVKSVETLNQSVPENGWPVKETPEDVQIEIAEQAEEKRINELSFEDRQKEFKTMRLQARRSAALKRSELELDEINPGASLKEAKDWYNEQVTELEEKYLQTSKIH